MHCYYCRAFVDEQEQAEGRKILEELWMTALFDDVEGVTPEDSFVHMTPAADELDAAGNPVVCARDMIREMAENIKPAHEEIEEDDE